MNPKRKGNIASVETVVGIFEKFLFDSLELLMNQDTAGVALLKIHKKTGIISHDLYRKMKDGYDKESIVKTLVQKVRGASMEQVLMLLDIVETVQGSSTSTSHIFRQALTHRPVVESVGGSNKWTAAVKQKEKERSEVLSSVVRVCLTDLATCSAERDNYRSRVAQLEATVLSLLSTVTTMRDENIAMKKRVDTYKKEKEDTESELEDTKLLLEEKKEELTVTERNLREALGTIELLKADMDEMKGMASVKEENADLKRVMQIQATSMKHENAELRRGLRKQEKKNETLASSMSEMRREHTKMKNRYRFNPKTPQMDLYTDSLPSPYLPVQENLREGASSGPLPVLPAIQDKHA